MNEQLLALWNRLRRKIDQVVIFALVLLLVVVILLYWAEQQAPSPEIPPLAMPPIGIKNTPPDWTTFTEVLFTHPPKLEWKAEYESTASLGKFREYTALRDFNMFDARSAKDRSELIAGLDQRFEAEARPAFERGDLDTAERVSREIIAKDRSHRKAIDLLRVIRERRKAEVKEGATP